MLGGPGVAEGVYKDLGVWPEVFRKIERQVGKPPRDVPRKYWPRLVTFSDIADPTSVMQVDPDDLSAVFGAGYALRAVTLEITDAPVTTGMVDGVLGWLGDYPEPGLCPPTGHATDIPFCRRVHHGDFIRRSK